MVLRPSDACVDCVRVGGRGVDLSGTSSTFIRSSFSTRSRDPVTRPQSDVLAMVHVSQNFSEIEHHSLGVQFACSDRSINVIREHITDDKAKEHGFSQCRLLTKD
jgi:hypothetical protein